ncbi:MAG: hypothetical protein ACOY90_22350 [Candidatus Zhuqueibacterota bacterium]
MKGHLKACSQCREYISILNETGALLNNLQDKAPASDTFDKILAGLPQEKPIPITEKSTIPILPLFEFAFAIMFILFSIYILQHELTRTELWLILQQNWLIQTIGSFGTVIFFLFCFSTFITLCLAPILIFDQQKYIRVISTEYM